jgi:drug/metabolite transporter (DMT)-like permease
MTLAQTRWAGLLLVLASAVLWSTAGLFVRMAALDVWSVVAWRSLFSVLVIGGYVVLRNRLERDRVERSFGWPGVVATAISAVASPLYIAALTWTSVANVMTLYATLPFMAGLIAFLWLRETVSARFVVAGLAAFAGVCLMVGAAFAPRDLLGVAAALGMTAGFAAELVIAKRYPTLDMPLMITASAAVCTVVALPFTQATVPGGQALLACALYGAISTGLAYIMVLVGGRLIGAGEAGFLSMLDVVLGPVWVWLFFDERIGWATFAGGTVVLLAVAWYLAGGPAPRSTAKDSARA